MLKECLTTILQQTHQDFEVIVGNDFMGDILTKESLGMVDERIKIINHPRNLGELDNMNYLLSKADGRYFSWLADDDQVSPYFLESIVDAITKFSSPECVFCSYCAGSEYRPESIHSYGAPRLLHGSKFLRQYLRRELKTIGCYGGFKTDYLKSIGGIERLGVGFSPYSDNLLAIRAGILEKVAFVEAPVVFFRTHDESLSLSSPELSSYSTAQQALLSRCRDIFVNMKLSSGYKMNMFLLLKWCSNDFYSVLRRGGVYRFRSVFEHLKKMEQYARATGFNYLKYLLLQLSSVLRHIIWNMRSCAKWV